MANFIPSKKEASDFNNGVAYVNADPTTGTAGDAVQAETVNNLVESALYTQQVVEQNATDLNTGITNLTLTLNNGIQQAQSIADSAVDIANDALDQVQDALSGGVTSVNGETGAVVITPTKIGASPTLYRHTITYSNGDDTTTKKGWLCFSFYTTAETPIQNIQSLYTALGGGRIGGVSGQVDNKNFIPLYIYFTSSSQAYVYCTNSGLSLTRLLYNTYTYEDDEGDSYTNNCFADNVTKIQ